MFCQGGFSSEAGSARGHQLSLVTGQPAVSEWQRIAKVSLGYRLHLVGMGCLTVNRGALSAVKIKCTPLSHTQPCVLLSPQLQPGLILPCFWLKPCLGLHPGLCLYCFLT